MFIYFAIGFALVVAWMLMALMVAAAMQFDRTSEIEEENRIIRKRLDELEQAASINSIFHGVSRTESR